MARLITSTIRIHAFLFLILIIFACGGGGGGGGGSTAPAVGDSSAPTVPTGLTVTPAKDYIALAWTASTDNVGVAGYKIYRDGAFEAAVAGISYQDSTGLVAGTQYCYAISAYDSAGNESAKTSASCGYASGTESEPNDDTSTTNQIFMNSRMYGSVALTESDFFKLVLTEDKNIKITLTFSAGGLYFFLWDTSAPIVPSYTGAAITYSATAGTYYIQVYAPNAGTYDYNVIVEEQ